MRQMETDGEIQNLRSAMIQTEDKLIEDIESLKRLFNPELVLTYLIALAKQELSLRLRQMDGDKLQAIASRVKDEVKGRPMFLGAIGLAVAGIAFYGLRPENRRALVEGLKENQEKVSADLPLKDETVPLGKSEVTCPGECSCYEI